MRAPRSTSPDCLAAVKRPEEVVRVVQSAMDLEARTAIHAIEPLVIHGYTLSPYQDMQPAIPKPGSRGGMRLEARQ